ncbi:MAG: hypothetical protein WC878_08015 [Candidatus Paceibacterota bacterium]|jgi:hypothetical protein
MPKDKNGNEANMKRILYFAHPINTYDTELEQTLIAKIIRMFPDCVIENPNQKKHREGYRRWKKKTGNGMQYYFSEVLPFCDGGLYLPFRDGTWGAGVFGEAKFFVQRNGTSWVWTIDAGALIRLVHLESVRALSVSETRARVYDSKGVFLPY